METELIYLCPAEGRFVCQVPKGVWHTVEVIEPSVIYEAKDGKYGEYAPQSLSFRLSAAHGALGSAACYQRDARNLINSHNGAITANQV